MPLLAPGRVLVKEAMVAHLAAALSVEKEPPSGSIAEETKQAVKDAQSISLFVSLTF